MDDRNDNTEYSPEEACLRWHARALDKAAVKFKVKESGRAELQLLANHPRQWLRGEDLPDGVLCSRGKNYCGAQGRFCATRLSNSLGGATGFGARVMA